jgi:hypothetical protein
MNMLEKDSDIALSKTSLKDKMAEIIDRLTVDQLEHFSYALEQVANCYLNRNSHGALLIANESDESQSLVAINASENQISEMVVFMADAMQGRQSSLGGMYIN